MGIGMDEKEKSRMKTTKCFQRENSCNGKKGSDRGHVSDLSDCLASGCKRPGLGLSLVNEGWWEVMNSILHMLTSSFRCESEESSRQLAGKAGPEIGGRTNSEQVLGVSHREVRVEDMQMDEIRRKTFWRKDRDEHRGSWKC